MAEGYITKLNGVKSAKVISLDENNEEVVTEIDKRIKFDSNKVASTFATRTRSLIQELTTNTYVETRLNLEFPISPPGGKLVKLLTPTITLQKGVTKRYAVIFDTPIFGAYIKGPAGMFIPTNWTTGRAYITNFARISSSEQTDDEYTVTLEAYVSSDFEPKASTNPTTLNVWYTPSFNYNYAGTNYISLKVNV